MKKIWIFLLIASVFAAGLAIGRATSGERGPKARSSEVRQPVAGEPEPEEAREVSVGTMTVKLPKAGAGKARGSQSFGVNIKVAGGTKPSPDLPPGNHFVEGQVRVEGEHDPLETELTLSSSGIGPEGKPYAHKRTGKLDGAGGFRFDGLPPGRYRITARHPEYSPHSFDLVVTDGGYVEPLEILLAPGGSLRIRVVGAAEKPKPGIRIQLEGQDDVRGTTSEGTTDEEGVLVVTQLPPGRYEVRRPGPDAQTKGETRFVTVVPGEEVEVLFISACTLKGKVIGPSRYPLKNAIIRLWPKSTGERNLRMSQVRTDGKGRYLFDGLEPGRYELSIQVVGKKENYSVSVGMIELAEGDEAERDVTVEPSKLAGRITRSDTGEPLSRRQVQISCWPAEVRDGEFVRNTGKLSMAFANKEGRYSFVGLQPGWYRIWIASHSPSFSDEWRLVDFPGGEMSNVDFALQARSVGKLRLTVLEPEGEAAGGLYFSVKTAEEGSRTLHGQRVSDGVYEFPMEVGEQVVFVSRKGFYATVEVTIEEGQTVQATAQLERPEGR